MRSISRDIAAIYDSLGPIKDEQHLRPRAVAVGIRQHTSARLRTLHMLADIIVCVRACTYDTYIHTPTLLGGAQKLKRER